MDDQARKHENRVWIQVHNMYVFMAMNLEGIVNVAKLQDSNLWHD